MASSLNWDLSKVINLIRQEADADFIMSETGIKQVPLQSIVSMLGVKDRKLYYIRGLFKGN
jgi:hypothetical protein